MIGGLSGIFLAAFPIDLYVTDSYFVVAHFHYVLGTVPVFAVIGGVHFWYPEDDRPDARPRAGRAQLLDACSSAFNMTFFPMHDLGLSGMRRRDRDLHEPLAGTRHNQIATIGAFMLAIGVLMVLWNCLNSLRVRAHRRPPIRGGEQPRVVHHLAAAAAQLRRPAPIRSERPLYDLRHAQAARRPENEHRCSTSPPPARTSVLALRLALAAL